MRTLDPVIRNGTVVTAVDSMLCDVGIRDGKIAALGTAMGPATRVINATGKPGAVQSTAALG